MENIRQPFHYRRFKRSDIDYRAKYIGRTPQQVISEYLVNYNSEKKCAHLKWMNWQVRLFNLDLGGA